MRTSTYEIILPLIGSDDKEIEGKALLVNGLYGAIDVVDEATAAKVREGDFAAIPFALRERLALRGISPGRMRRENWLTHGCWGASGAN